jgi:ABC-type uncharacterized transport system involved in gliding motility auxiliary subunit
VTCRSTTFLPVTLTTNSPRCQTARRTAAENGLMLVLARKVGEQMRIAADVVVVVPAIPGDRIKSGIDKNSPEHPATQIY